MISDATFLLLLLSFCLLIHIQISTAATQNVTFHTCGDDSHWVYVDGVLLASNDIVHQDDCCKDRAVTVVASASVIGVKVRNFVPGTAAGWKGYFSDGTVVNASTWKCTTTSQNDIRWTLANYDDSSWWVPAQSTCYSPVSLAACYCSQTYYPSTSLWMWTDASFFSRTDTTIYCRTKLVDPCDSNSCQNGGTCSKYMATATTANCTCPAPFKGSVCEIGCTNKFWGVNCNQPCGQCFTPQCDTITGLCVGGSNGCRQWYTGDFCNISIVTCSLQDLTVNILSDNSAQVNWACAGLSNISSQFYYFSINSSTTSTVIKSLNQSIIITGALPPNGVYDMSVTVTMCRTQYSVTDCTAGLTTRTSCGVPDSPRSVDVFINTYSTDSNNYTINWTTPLYKRCSNPVSYAVSILPKSSRGAKDPTQIFMTTTNTFIDVVLQHSYSYSVFVITVGPQGSSAPSSLLEAIQPQPFMATTVRPITADNQLPNNSSPATSSQLPSNSSPTTVSQLPTSSSPTEDPLLPNSRSPSSVSTGTTGLAVGLGVGLGVGLLIVIIVLLVLLIRVMRREHHHNTASSSTGSSDANGSTAGPTNDLPINYEGLNVDQSDTKINNIQGVINPQNNDNVNIHEIGLRIMRALERLFKSN